MGLFIVFEGMDGSGQTTQAKLLYEKLKEDGYKVWLTKEPTENYETGKLIRKILKEESPFNNLALQLLFMADRAYHVDEIKEKLKKGYIVISDRYFFSTIVYSSLSNEKYYDIFKKFNEKFFPLPDILFILLLDPKVAIKRIEKRGGKKEVFEDLEKLKKIKEGYERIFRDYKGKIKVKILNAEKSISELSEEIFEKGLIKYA